MSRVPPSIDSDLETLFHAGATVRGDRPLLDRFLEGGDAAGPAFEQIVARHGPMVLGVCRRVAGDAHMAEDAFQATFLVLALRAGVIRRRESLGPWLHGVATRVARRARDAASRRRRREAVGPPPEPTAPETATAEAGLEDLRRVLDEELGRLPDKYRDPMVLCYLEGKSQEETARILGWTKGTVSGRLARAKEALRQRLVRRGVSSSTGMLATTLNLSGVTPMALPTALSSATVRGALAAAIDAGAASVSTPVLRLARGAARGMPMIPPATIPACLTLTALGVIGAWSLAAYEGGSPRPVPAVPVRTAARISGTRDSSEDPLPTGATLRFGSPRFRHPTTIEGLAVSPDGRVAAATSGTLIHGSVRAYDLTSGRVKHSLDTGSNNVTAVAFSPRGNTLAAATTFNPAVLLFDMASGMQTARAPYPAAIQGSVGDVLLFTPDGKHVVSKAADGKSLLLIDPDAGGVRHTFSCGGIVFAAALSPDGRFLVAGGFDYEENQSYARRWEVNTGRELEPVVLPKGTVRSAAYSPDGSVLALGIEARQARVDVVDAANGEQRLAILLPDASRVRSLAYSPDGKTLAVAGGPTTRLFDAVGKELLKIDRRATGLRFAPDGTTLIGAVAGTIFLWDATSGRPLIPEGGESPVDQIAATADGRRLVTRGQDGDAHVWDARTGAHLRRVNVGWQRGFALSPDGRFLVWPEPDETISFPSNERPGSTRTGCRLVMIDIATGAAVGSFRGFRGDAHDLSFSSDGRSLLTAERYARGAAVRTWDVETGEVLREFAAEWQPTGRVWRSRFSPDGKVLAVLYQEPMSGLAVETKVKLWEIATGQEVAGTSPPWFDPEVIALAPDGKTIAVTPSSGTTIQLRDLATGLVRGEFREPRDRVTALAFGPDGRLYSGATDGTVLAWDPQIVNRAISGPIDGEPPEVAPVDPRRPSQPEPARGG